MASGGWRLTAAVARVRHPSGSREKSQDMLFTLTIELPADVAQSLQRSGTDLCRLAKEALALALFQQGDLTHAALGLALELDRFETDALLKRRQIYAGGLSIEDLEQDQRSLDEVLGPAGRRSSSATLPPDGGRPSLGW